MEDFNMEIKDLPEKLLNHPLVKKIEQDEKDQTAAKRRELFSLLASAEARCESEKKPLDKIVADAEKALVKAREELKAAEINRGKAEWDLKILTSDLYAVELKVKKGLIETAPEIIDEFISEMNKKWYESKDKVQVSHYVEQDPISHRGKKFHYDTSNYSSVVSVTGYLMSAIKEAEGLKLMDITPEQVEARLAELRAGIPKISPFLDDTLDRSVEMVQDRRGIVYRDSQGREI